MSDIFLSYSSEDRARVAVLAKALVGASFSVWWDRDIRPGTDFSGAIEREIKSAKAVVVVWTEHSARSEWVRDEAAYGRSEGKLIPLRFSEAEPPLGFRQTQAIDFRKWRADPRSPAFLALRAALDGLLTGESETAFRAAEPSVAKRAWQLVWRRRTGLVVVVALLVIVTAVSAWLNSPFAPGAHSVAMGAVEIRPFSASPDDAERLARATMYADAFRQRLTELGIPNGPELAGGAGPRPELSLTGELAAAGGTEVLTARLDERASGTTLWSVRGKPSEGAAAEANLTGFAMQCALQRRDPDRGAQLFAHFLRGCAQYHEGDFAGWLTTAKSAHALAPDDPNSLAFLAVANAGQGWSDANSEAEHQRLIGEAKRLAEEALRLDAENADALFAMGFTYDDFQFKEQEEWWRRAVESDLPGWGTGRYAQLLFTVGRVRESLDMEVRALQGRRTAWGGARAARRFAAQGNFFEAQRLFNLVRPLDPLEVGINELLAFILYGDLEPAQRMLAESQKALALPNAQMHCFERLLAVRRGEPVGLPELTDGCEVMSAYGVSAFAGHLDAAFTEADRAVEANRAFGRFPPHFFTPEFDEFRRDARFWPLAAKMGLVDYWLDTNLWPDFCTEPDLPFDCRQQAAAARLAQSMPEEVTGSE